MPTPPVRTSQLARIEAVCRAAASGHGHLLLVTGEAGIGKTWLAGRALELAETAGMRRARGWCLEDPTAPPLWLWRRLARDIPGVQSAVAAFETSDGQVEARLALVERLGRDLAEAAATNGLLVVLEDLHWAEELSLDVLARLLPELAVLPVVVVATARDDALDGTAFGSGLGRLVRGPNAGHLSLTGLDVEEVSRLLAGDERTEHWVPRAGELAALTDGNPFYLVSLTTELSEAPDADIDAALAQRPTWRHVLASGWEALGLTARQTVGVAAVLGERVAPTLVATAVGGRVDDAAEHLNAGVRSGLLRFGETGLAFRHALVRDAVVASLSPEELVRAHEGVARALESTGEDLLLGLAAGHWSKVPGPEAAARCRALATTVAAAQRFGPDRVAELARLAVGAARFLDAPPGELAEGLLLQARLEWAAGDQQAALQACVEGMDLAESAGRPDLLADLALVPHGSGDPATLIVTATMNGRALRLLPASDAGRRARLLAQAALAAAEAAQPLLGELPHPDDHAHPDPDALSAEALELARRTGDPLAELEALAARHYVLSYPQALEARTVLVARALELAPAAPSTMGALWGHLWSADLAGQQGHLHAVRSTITTIEGIARQRSSPIARWHALRLTAGLAVLEGRFNDSRGSAAQAREIAERIGDISMIGMYYAFGTNLGMLRGDPSEVPAGFEEMIRATPPMPLIRISRVQIRALVGDLDGARALLEPFRGLAERFPLGPRWAGTIGQIGMAAVTLADADLAATCHALLLPTSGWLGGDGGGTPIAGGSCARVLGDLARTMGDRTQAVDHYAQAIAIDEAVGAPPSAALSRLGLALCLTDTDPGRASELAVAALRAFRRLDMPGPAVSAKSLLDGLAASLDRSGLSSLTAREREVARLVAETLTNQQIAERLFLSVRTVESHVRSILAKRGFTTRTEIVLWIRSSTTTTGP